MILFFKVSFKALTSVDAASLSPEQYKHEERVTQTAHICL